MTGESRYELTMTSDAFPDPEDLYAIWDNRFNEYYANEDGRIVTFPNEADATQYLKELQAKKSIRFVDSHYNEIFRIPDGGSIVVARPMGEMYHGVQEQWVGTCKYLDECHSEINGECYHIDQFAEIQGRIGSTYSPEPEPERVGNYRITRRTIVGDKIFKLGHNPKAAQPYGTWQSYTDNPEQNDWGHYWTEKSIANTDFFRRVEAERTGVSYDHTTLIKPPKERDGR
jgi:hypothetical protein